MIRRAKLEDIEGQALYESLGWERDEHFYNYSF
jgi:hypothetical protein